ncbi:MAG: thioredoxin [Tannerella sp.]|jgi:thioredoxin|nr:thioredoxin [Tannerella sp.]
MEKIDFKSGLTKSVKDGFCYKSFTSDAPCIKRWLFCLLFSLTLFNIACSNAQSTGNAGGEVILMNKADFLTKVYNYEKNSAQWTFEGKKPCIIDFYADWCGPCKRIAPIMKELASEYKGRIDIYKIDVDKESELATAFGITSIPLILFVPVDGKPQAAQGFLPKETIIEQINQFLLGKRDSKIQ